MNHDDAVARNLESWEQRTPIHLRSPGYRRGIETLRRRESKLGPPIDSELGDVRGLRVLHLQCHIGLDTLSLALLGADVTGLDFSPAAVAAARGFSRELALPARFVIGDAQAADQVLRGEQFDLVFASFGVFCWIPELTRWMNSAAALLKPGGTLYVADSHPLLEILEDDPTQPHGFEIRHSYFQEDGLVFGPSKTYADDGSGQQVAGTVQYTHSLGKLVTSVVQAGLQLEFLHEFPGAMYHACRPMVETSDGVWDFPPPLTGRLPMIFSIRARKQ